MRNNMTPIRKFQKQNSDLTIDDVLFQERAIVLFEVIQILLFCWVL